MHDTKGSAAHNQFDDEDNDGNNKQHKAEAVDAMHILNPLRLRPIRVGLTQVQVFGYLSEHAHGGSNF